MAGKPQIVFKSKDEFVLKYIHAPIPEYLHYDSVVTIKDGGKKRRGVTHMKRRGVTPEEARGHTESAD